MGTKEVRLNIRITPEFKQDLQAIADHHGLTLSSYVHSVLVRQIRTEKTEYPEAFTTCPPQIIGSAEVKRFPVDIDSPLRRDVQQAIDDVELAQPKRRRK